MKNITVFVSENFKFWEEKFSIYLNRCVFVTIFRPATLVQSISNLPLGKELYKHKASTSIP